MERHLKIFIFTIIFLVATSGYAEEYVQLEDDDPSVSAQELAMERWMKMRQQPDLTETSGTERRSVPIRKAAPSKAKAASKSKTSKNVKSANKKESVGDADQAPVEIDKAVGATAKAKSPEDAGKTKAPEGASKAKAPDGASKKKGGDEVSKAKSLAGARKPED